MISKDLPYEFGSKEHIQLDRDLVYAVVIALRESADVHAAERSSFGPELTALADHLDGLLHPVHLMKRDDLSQVIDDAYPRCPVCRNLLATDGGLEPDVAGCPECGWRPNAE